MAADLEKHTALLSLDLSWNELDAEASEALVHALAHTTTLTRLNLRGNHFDEEARSSFRAASLESGVDFCPRLKIEL